jgi:hypothetical protein
MSLTYLYHTPQASMSNPNDHTVGWICALKTEYITAQSFLDEEHSRPEYLSTNNSNQRSQQAGLG